MSEHTTRVAEAYPYSPCFLEERAAQVVQVLLLGSVSFEVASVSSSSSSAWRCLSVSHVLWGSLLDVGSPIVQTDKDEKLLRCLRKQPPI